MNKLRATKGSTYLASGGLPPSLPPGLPARPSRPGQLPPKKSSSGCSNISSSSKRPRQGPREGEHAEDAARKHAAWSAARPSMQESHMTFTQHRALLRHEQMQLELSTRQQQLSGAWQLHSCCEHVGQEESEPGHCCSMEGKDESHRGCVLIKCVEDPRTFSLDTQQVRQWLATYALQSSTNTFVEADKLEQDQAHVQGNLPRSSKRARVERSSPAGNGTSYPVSSSMASEEQEEEFLPRSGPPKKGVTRRAEVLDLIGKEVDVPGPVFHDHTPGVYLRAYIIGPDSEHASAVELYLLTDPRTMYYFHASEARHWVRLMRAREASKQDLVNQQDAEDEAVAAEVLAQMSGCCSNNQHPAQSSKPAAVQTPPATLPDFATQAKGPGHKKKRGSLAPAGRAATPPPLQWGPTQVLAQRASALPPVLAEQLARIANAQGGTQQAAGATPSAAIQVLSSKPARRSKSLH